jgi:1,4-dihydroxy-2-naphthoate polyprenyltransferase
MPDFKYIFGPMRIPFLLLNPVCVLLGTATAFRAVGHVNVLHSLLALVGAVSAHISVNAFNEYCDCRSGLDSRTERTPFSGGSGVLPQNPAMARCALYTALAAWGLTALIGLFFFAIRGAALLPLGILGLFVIAAYTPWFTHQPLVCLIAPGLGFGPLMVMGTHFALTGHYSWTAFIASLVPFFLVSNLLLLNQFPDVEADRSVGRRHYPIVIGRRRSSLIYGLFLLLTYAAILFGVHEMYFPKASLLGLATLLVAVPLSIGAFRHAEDIKRLIPYMGLNVAVNLVTPLLVAIGLFVG